MERFLTQKVLAIIQWIISIYGLLAVFFHSSWVKSWILASLVVCTWNDISSICIGHGPKTIAQCMKKVFSSSSHARWKISHSCCIHKSKHFIPIEQQQFQLHKNETVFHLEKSVPWHSGNFISTNDCYNKKMEKNLHRHRIINKLGQGSVWCFEIIYQILRWAFILVNLWDGQSQFQLNSRLQQSEQT